MAQISLTVEMVADIPNQPFTAKVTRVVNSSGNDITRVFNNYCTKHGLPLTSQGEIEVATERFVKDYANTSTVLP